MRLEQSTSYERVCAFQSTRGWIDSGQCWERTPRRSPGRGGRMQRRGTRAWRERPHADHPICFRGARRRHLRKAADVMQAADGVNRLVSEPDEFGHWGRYGGRYVPETLVAPLEELTAE